MPSESYSKRMLSLLFSSVECRDQVKILEVCSVNSNMTETCQGDRLIMLEKAWCRSLDD